MDRIRHHWPEYLMEGAALGLFMVSAGVFTMLLEFPGSPLHHAIASGFLRRAIVGLAMGATAAALIYSPWGKQSGAHMNPAVTLSFLRLGKIHAWDAIYYLGAQFAGGLLGVYLVAVLFRGMFVRPPVLYIVTVPGPSGIPTAFIAEFLISFVLMAVVLSTSRTPRLSPYTGIFAATLVFLYVTFEAPLSGMSMNPARTFASALPGFIWTSIWIYFMAPVAGMLSAAELYRVAMGHHPVCPKIFHGFAQRCIFCGWKVKAQPEKKPKAAGTGI